MGQSLSEPVTAKETSLKQTANLLIGSSAMQGWRPRMEDAHAVHTRLSSPAPPAAPRPAAAQPAVTYAGVFDGHGGAKVARYAAEHLHRRLAAAGAAAPLSESSSPDAVEPIRAAFLEVDRDLRLRRADGGAGSTALVLLVDDSTIRCASVGDSRAVLSVAGRPVQLSRDHHPGASAERARILAAGGRVVGGRVNGRLAISRALGDFSFKRSGKRPPSEQMVTADPSVCVQTITNSMEFVVMASDGVWEVMSNQEVVSFVRSRLARGMNPDAVCEALLDHCLAPDRHNGRTGKDNITAIIVGLLHGRGSSGLFEACAKPVAAVADAAVAAIAAAATAAAAAGAVATTAAVTTVAPKSAPKVKA
ncbi:hypothetical protein BOX15_Mlig000843g4 [Macrostomum lignano]|uniref:protein-serine/threonine phosphatase n=1 Tax=Macrostomum lignano TaxID=282301 RepID=A0A267G2A8_9PLAT|nr:hypothetical protein BOX15_Mlig000843g4 [Macrostomum lignano]